MRSVRNEELQRRRETAAFPGVTVCIGKEKKKRLLVLLVSTAFLTEEFWILGHSSGKKMGQEIRRLGKG